jgi:hypothetical protein
LSFAGADRAFAERINDVLQEMEFEVFYDFNEQHRMLAEDIEDYLRPIYQADARFVVALLGPEFTKKIWTKFESDQFRKRFASGSVIPIWFTTAPAGMFDESTRFGGFTFDPLKPMESQVQEIADLLRRKLAAVRQGDGAANATLTTAAG